MVRGRTHHRFLVGAVVRLRLPVERKISNSFNVENIRGENRTERLSTYQSSIFFLGAFVATLNRTLIASAVGAARTNLTWEEIVARYRLTLGTGRDCKMRVVGHDAPTRLASAELLWGRGSAALLFWIDRSMGRP
jgi:hypothetical protein